MMMTFSGHFLYRYLTALCVLLALLFAWQLVNRWDWGALLFLGVALWSAWRCLKLMSSKVELTTDRLRILAMGEPVREVEYRQLSALYEEGRGLKAILLLYHPRLESGFFDLDQELSVVLPAVNRHEELLAALKAQAPA